MKPLQIGFVVAWGALAGAGCGCAPEMEGSTVAELTQQDALEAASDPELGGAAGQGAEEPEQRSTDGAIYALDEGELAGSVSFAPGSAWSGEIEVFCCREGSYSVYVYEGGRCSDPDSWDVELSSRVAELSCSRDVGSAGYVRTPSEAATSAFVIYDATGNAAGCADVATE